MDALSRDEWDAIETERCSDTPAHTHGDIGPEHWHAGWPPTNSNARDANDNHTMTPNTTDQTSASAAAQELRDWAAVAIDTVRLGHLRRNERFAEAAADVMRNAANVIDDLLRRVAVLEGEGA